MFLESVAREGAGRAVPAKTVDSEEDDLNGAWNGDTAALNEAVNDSCNRMDRWDERKDETNRRNEVVDVTKAQNHLKSLCGINRVSNVSEGLSGDTFVLDRIFLEFVVLICVNDSKRNWDSQSQECADDGWNFPANFHLVSHFFYLNF